MRQLLIAVLVCLLAAIATPGPGYAADAGQVFTEGKKLFDHGEYEAALAKFREALGLSGSPNARLYVARCLQNLGRLPEAYEEMQRAMREAAEKAPTDSKYVSTRDAAAAQVAIMEPKIGKLVIALVGAGDTVNVTLDGQPVLKERLGQPIPVEPKTVSLIATETGKKNAERKIEIKPGQTVTVTLELRAEGEGGGSAPTGTATTTTEPPPPVDTGPSQITPLRGLGIAALVLGVGGGVTFAVTGIMVNKKQSSLENDYHCTSDGACPTDGFQDTASAGKTLQIVADIGLGVGIAGVIGGVLLLVLGGPDEEAGGAPKEKEGGTPTASFGPNGGSIGYVVRF